MNQKLSNFNERSLRFHSYKIQFTLFTIFTSNHLQIHERLLKNTIYSRKLLPWNEFWVEGFIEPVYLKFYEEIICSV